MAATGRGGRGTYLRALVITFVVPEIGCVLVIARADTTTSDVHGCGGSLISKPGGAAAAAGFLLVGFAAVCAAIAMRRRWRRLGRPSGILVALAVFVMCAVVVVAAAGAFVSVALAAQPFCIPW